MIFRSVRFFFFYLLMGVFTKCLVAVQRARIRVLIYYQSIEFFIIFLTYGFHPKSCGFKYRMPARDTVAGVAVRRLDISKISRIEGVRAMRSLLASVST